MPIDARLSGRDDVRDDGITDSAMGSLRTWRGWRARATFAGLIACLFVIKSLVHFVSPAFVVDVGGGASAVQIAVYCGTAGADKAPTDERRDQSQCCILCSAGARDATADVIGDGVTPPRFVPPASIASIVFFDVRVVCERPSGCMSSWSSRAPPRV